MRKEDIIREIAFKTGIERQDVDMAVNALFTVIKQNLMNGEDVYFRGFGSFIVRKRAAKKARNITRNETLMLKGQQREIREIMIRGFFLQLPGNHG